MQSKNNSEFTLSMYPAHNGIGNVKSNKVQFDKQWVTIIHANAMKPF